MTRAHPPHRWEEVRKVAVEGVRDRARVADVQVTHRDHMHGPHFGHFDPRERVWIRTDPVGVRDVNVNVGGGGGGGKDNGCAVRRVRGAVARPTRRTALVERGD